MRKHRLLLSSILASSFIVGGIASAASGDTYTVVAGDTLKIIAQKQEVSLESLIAANSQVSNFNMIYPGMTIYIPAKSGDQQLPKSVTSYTVATGDTLKVIAQKFSTSLADIIKANPQISNFDVIYPGMTIYIHTPTPTESLTQPDSTATSHVAKSGDMLWKIAQTYSTTIEAIKQLNHLSNDQIMVGQILKIPTASLSPKQTEPLQAQPSPEKPWIEYQTHIVQQGETGWTIAIKYGIPFAEFLKQNNLTESSWLSVGQKVTIPIHHIPVKPTLTSSSGELLDWFTEAQYVFPIGAVAKVTDVYTKKSWNIKRTLGAFHADSEPLTTLDAEIMKNVWGGNYSWAVRPILLEVGGRRLAASMSSMPHDIQSITDNQFPGHFDVHFLNSLRHKDAKMDLNHQAAVKVAGGVQ